MIEEKVKDILKKYRNLEQRKRFDKCICGVRKRI